MPEKTPEQHLIEAAHKLAGQEHEEIRRELAVFIDYWGLDSYTPPDHVEARVRDIVMGFVRVAQIIAADQPTQPPEAP